MEIVNDGESRVTVDGEEFLYGFPNRHGVNGSPPVLKSSVLVDQLIDLVARLVPERIVEIGVHRGGSVALISALARPVKMVAIELSPSREDVLDEYLRRVGRSESVVPYHGVDQQSPEVQSILDSEFGSTPIDLVVDDASHLFEPTRRSFEMIFPRLREGGVYVIEDWAGEHMWLASVVDAIARLGAEDRGLVEGLAAGVEALDPELARILRGDPDRETVVRAARTAGAAKGRSLSRLGLEIVHLVAESRDIVREVSFTQGWIEITRGEGAVEGADWLDRGSMDLFGSLTD